MAFDKSIYYMRKIFIYPLFFILFAACKNNKNKTEISEENETEKTENTKKITKKDNRINA